MRSAIILLALTVLAQVCTACFWIGVYGCIDVNTNCALLSTCARDIDAVCVNFPESLNDKMNSVMGWDGTTLAEFYEHSDCQGALLFQSGYTQYSFPTQGTFEFTPWTQQASSVMLRWYSSPY